MTKQPMLTQLNDSSASGGRFGHLNGWQLALTLIPLALLFAGGAIGGAIGAIGALSNAAIAKTNLSTPVKALSMIGVVLASGVVFLVAAALIAAAIGK
ncbi:hypothetical protein ACFYST_17515 [Kitasatospora sp. NPDC004614]|uniref:hypothetical protein n=1 Tax=unclassified Kitasatospora TaxID=2633591 RepID=UPI0036C84AED